MYRETTIISPEIAIMLGICGLLTLLLPKRFALVFPILVAAFFPITQRFALAGLNLHVVRLIFLIAFARIFFRGEHRDTGFILQKADKALLIWVFVTSVSFVLLRIGEAPVGAVLNRLAVGYDILGVYFLFRLLLSDLPTLRVVLRTLCFVAVGLSLFMLNEQFTGMNWFSRYSGDLRHSIVGIEIIPEYSFVRDGNIRAQGPFLHPILAGTVGASFFPIFFFCWREKLLSITCLVGTIASIVIVFTSFSSGPVLALVGAILGIVAWRVRRYMKMIVWATLGVLFVLHLVMTAPVWALIWRASVLTGSTGYHRYALIDNAIERVSEWWLLGIKSTADWGYFQFDVTNQYLNTGFDGGIAGLLLFVIFLYYAFRRVGFSIHSSRYSDQERRINWALGSALFSYVVAFFGVSVFGSLYVFFYMTAAMVVTCPDLSLKLSRSSAENEEVPWKVEASSVGEPVSSFR